jgi:hypothetical protein
MAAMWDWLRDPDNRGALEVIGSAIAFLWSVYVYLAGSKFVGRGGHKEHSERIIAPLPSVLLMWAVGIIILGSLTFYITQIYMQPTPVKVCQSEESPDCPPHDVFVGCSSPEAWARDHCLKFEGNRTYSRSGGQCGHDLWVFACYKKALR